MGATYNPKLSIVRVENLRLRAFIGFMDWETEKLQDIIISFSFKYDTALASETDEVENAVDYKNITKGIIDFVDQKSFHLIEALAEKIYTYIQSSNAGLQDIWVKVEKPNALRFTDNVMVQIDGSDRYNTAVIALGSNINDDANFTKALAHLQQLGFIMQRTEFIKTKPLKFEDQAEFLNGAILLHTKKSLSEIKMHLKQIEALLGRVRIENKNAPREIDLDVLTYNGFIIDKDIEELPFLIDFVQHLQPEIQL
ncbi:MULTISPECIES: 2-amino-4-hydroxy-6-hydroxymethyldihydropteridine diphosphokinase [unclassified Kaistella]|uniref:2-amino-4-hydroxy-6- hydroxymethyldihydropteridine diphosphokinase n=1 Tax=unclassified Kaistella TaxID=2762626 RepID=UPI00273567C1|nr:MULTISPECIES: 2-amino-4-hydroxy-6-hydroxymethyldihydropteridine diphosphokinase [unclassified Kaistella]MDP2453338.1 2-amino-4-hydroxy-6-hydroxymethyldihydropteridine diphosphokinase [Kaistella sp. SH11-4b]MDP2456395.1 2-amino-4-hydroxy-6-hydroxymethyldihydropteridine diphosphokinase [Kaistella sp. SH40-3]MDP2459151.1 2-amino-4-hydroxy-6-hydroxymethyldihydropteridine diphosphokinase [Kaistella sp. SH19-2b]